MRELRYPTFEFVDDEGERLAMVSTRCGHAQSREGQLGVSRPAVAPHRIGVPQSFGGNVVHTEAQMLSGEHLEGTRKHRMAQRLPSPQVLQRRQAQGGEPVREIAAVYQR